MQDCAKHSILPPFEEKGNSDFARYWTLMRDCRIEDGYISLTKAWNSQAGALWNREPCQSESWKVEINYRMHSTSETIADGLAFWYVPAAYARTGEVYGGMNDFIGLLVAMDNFQNAVENRPLRGRDESLILAVYQDREKWFNFSTANEGGNDKERLRRNRIRNPDEKTTLIIDYDSELKLLTVTSKDFQGEAECFRIRNINIPTGNHFGLTARTGGFNCNHDIITMKTFVKPNKQPISKVAEVRPFVKNPITFVDEPNPPNNFSYYT